MMTGARTVAVVGPGAIGTTVAVALHEVGRTSVVCGRTPRDRLELHAGDDRIMLDAPVLTDPAAVDGPVDLVFLAVKATQTDGAADWLRALCGPDTVVCVLQNGIEQVASVGPLVGDAEVVPAVVWFPAESQPDGSVRLHADARLTIPAGGSPAPAEALADGRIAVEVAEDFTTLAWQKLLQNAAAGLMALAGRRSGMYRREDVGQLTEAYLREGLAVARAEGARLGDDLPAEVVEGFRSRGPDLGTSILADREAGRPLEWAVRNDVLRRRARVHSIPTPIGDVVVPLLAAASDGPG